MSIVLESKNLSVGISRDLFHGLSIQLKRGELVALLGKNGVGKSTILKTFSRQISYNKGAIFLDHKNYDQYNHLDFARKVAIVTTDKIEVDYLKVQDLLLLGRSPYISFLGNYSKEDFLIVDEIAKDLNLTSLLDFYYSDLSDGQKQKVLIGRALAQRPMVLILDEPTTFLDISSKLELMKYFSLISKRDNVAVLFSTHDLSLIEGHVDKVWLIGDKNYSRYEIPEVLFTSGDIEKILIKSESR